MNLSYPGGPPSCPRCGGLSVVPIVYGYPAEETAEAAERGEIVLGGCIVWEGRPNWHCTNCENSWVHTEGSPIDPAAVEAALLRVEQSSGEEKGEALLSLVNIYSRSGEYDAADAALEEARRLTHEELRTKVASCLYNMAMALGDRGDWEKAIPYAEEAHARFASIDHPYTAPAEQVLAMLLASAGRLEEALPRFESAKLEFLETFDAHAAADCDYDIAHLHEDLGQPRRSLRHLKAARAGFAQTGDTRQVGTCEIEIATLLGNLGDHRGALRHLGDARAVFEANEQDWEVAHCDQLSAGILQKQGDLSKSFRSFLDAARSYESGRAQFDAAACYDYAADVAHLIGDFEMALSLHQHSREMFAQFEEIGDAAIVDCKIASDLEHLERFEEALLYLDKATEAFERLHREKDLAWTDVGSSSILARLGKVIAARSRWEKGHRWFEDTLDSGKDTLAWCDYQLALILHAEGRSEEALDVLRSFESAGASHDAAFPAEVEERAAEILLTLGRNGEARVKLRQARARYSEQDLPLRVNKVEKKLTSGPKNAGDQ